MGKPRHKRRADIRLRMDQQQQRDRPDPAKLGSLRDLGKPIDVHPDRLEPIQSREPDHDLPVDQTNIRRLGERIRVPRSAPPTLRRSFDAGDINPILNDPAVFPSIAVPGIEVFDIAPILADPRNVLLMMEGGGIVFIWQEPGVYEVHTNFLPSHRGRHALRASSEAYRWMFVHTDCMELQTRVPAFNKAADWFCGMVGATKQFERKAVWPTADGLVDMAFWTMSYADWVRKCPDLIDSGRAFHMKLEAEFHRHGRTEPRHAEEDCHDRYVGACAEMIYAGQPEKAVILYNRWARFAGYGMIALVSKEPLVIDIGDAVLQVIEGHTFKAVLCRGKA